MDDLEKRLEALLSDHIHYLALSALEMEAKPDAARARAIAAAYAKKAIELERRIALAPGEPHESDRVACATLAARAVHLSGSDEARRKLIAELGSDGVASLMRALAYDISDLLAIAHGSTTWRDEREAAGRLLLDAAMAACAD